MLIDILNSYVARMGFDADFSGVNEASDDYLDVIDPDLDFDAVRAKILKDFVLSKRVVNQTIISVELFDTTWDAEGNKINVVVLLSKGSLGFGTRAKVLVKTIDVMIGGSVKSFLSIEAYNNYMKSKSAEV